MEHFPFDSVAGSEVVLHLLDLEELAASRGNLQRPDRCLFRNFLMDPYWRASLGRLRQFSPAWRHYFKKLLKLQPECINVATHSPQKIKFWLLSGDFKWKTSSFFLFFGNQGFFKCKNLTIIRQKKKHLHSGRPFYQSGVRSDYTSNVVGRSGLSSSEYAGDRRITKASTRPLQPVREEGRWPTPRDFLTFIDRLKR